MIKNKNTNNKGCSFIGKYPKLECDRMMAAVAAEMEKITQACYVYGATKYNSNTTWETAYKAGIDPKGFNPPGAQPGKSNFEGAETCKKCKEQ